MNRRTSVWLRFGFYCIRLRLFGGIILIMNRRILRLGLLVSYCLGVAIFAVKVFNNRSIALDHFPHHYILIRKLVDP